MRLAMPKLILNVVWPTYLYFGPMQICGAHARAKENNIISLQMDYAIFPKEVTFELVFHFFLFSFIR
jgi:hypothetical protein